MTFPAQHRPGRPLAHPGPHETPLSRQTTPTAWAPHPPSSTAPGLELHPRVIPDRVHALQASIDARENTSHPAGYDAGVRTPIRNPPDPMYAEFEVHRTMICDRVRTGAFRRAIDSVVRPGDIVLDVGAGSGILSVFAARAGAARVYAVERTSAAVLAQELAAANGVAEIVQVIHGDVIDVELPERVDVIVSEWLGGFGIDEGMLVPVIVARDRWLKPGGVMIPRSGHGVGRAGARPLPRGDGGVPAGQPVRPQVRRPESRRPSTRSSIPAPSVTSRRVTGAPRRASCGRRTPA